MSAGQTNVIINRLILRNTISNYLGKFINLGIWFFLTPFILSQLGQTTYGLWVLIASIVSYGSLFDLGIAGAITKYVAEFRTKNDYQNAQGLIATALSLYTILGIIVFSLSIVIAPFIPKLFNVPPEQSTLSIRLIIISGLGIGLSIPSTATPAILRGLQRFDFLNLVSTIGTLLYAAGAIVVLLITKNVLWLVIVSILVNLFVQIPYIWSIHRVEPQIKLGWKGTNRKLIRTVASFSSALFILNLNGYLETKTDEIVIGASLPVSSVTPYNIALRLSSIPQMLTSQFLYQILPLASAIHANNDREKLGSLYVISTRLTLVLFLPIGVIITIFSKEILTLWVGANYSIYSYLVVILLVASFIDTSTWPAGYVLQGMARHQLLSVVSLVSGISNLVLSIIFVRIYGLTGVAIGTLIPTTIVCLFFVYPYSMRLIGVNLKQLITKILLPTFLPAVPMVGGLLILGHLLNVNGLAFLLLAIGIGFLLFCISYLIFNPGMDESIAVIKLLVRITKYVKMRLNFS